VRHPLHQKIIQRRNNVQAHDPDNACRVGDSVVLEESPRFSKTKAWKVLERQGEQS